MIVGILKIIYKKNYYWTVCQRNGVWFGT